MASNLCCMLSSQGVSARDCHLFWPGGSCSRNQLLFAATTSKYMRALNFHQCALKHLIDNVLTFSFHEACPMKPIRCPHPLIVKVWLHQRTLRSPFRNRRLVLQPAQHLPRPLPHLLPTPLPILPADTSAPRRHPPTSINMFLEPANHLIRTVSVPRARPLRL